MGILIGGLVVAGIIGLIYWLSNQPDNGYANFDDGSIVEETTTTTTIITEERHEERN
jgi:hypothetical protein